MITPDIERQLYRVIEHEARDLGCIVIALNGTDDHVHLLVAMRATLSVAELIKQVKGTSSRFVNDALQPKTQFKWQANYGALTVSRWDIDRIVAYIKRQKDHHANGETVPELEQTHEER